MWVVCGLCGVVGCAPGSVFGLLLRGWVSGRGLCCGDGVRLVGVGVWVVWWGWGVGLGVSGVLVEIVCVSVGCPLGGKGCSVSGA